MVNQLAKELLAVKITKCDMQLALVDEGFYYWLKPEWREEYKVLIQREKNRLQLKLKAATIGIRFEDFLENRDSELLSKPKPASRKPLPEPSNRSI